MMPLPVSPTTTDCVRQRLSSGVAKIGGVLFEVYYRATVPCGPTSFHLLIGLLPLHSFFPISWLRDPMARKAKP